MDELDLTEKLPNGADRYRKLASGVIYDNVVHHIVRGNSDPQAMSDMVKHRYAIKRQTMIDAANAAVERGDLKALHGDKAFLAEIATALQKRATQLDDLKGVDAAKLLIQETGHAEPKVPESVTQNNYITQISPELMRLLDDMVRVGDEMAEKKRAQAVKSNQWGNLHEVVEGQVKEEEE